MPTPKQETQILLPINVEQFMSEYWEKQPLYISRDNASFITGLLTATSIFEQLTKRHLYFPGVQLTRASSPITAQEYSDSKQKINAEQIKHFHEEGATVVWSKIHDSFASVRALCLEIQSALKLPCSANAYLSPASQQGFNAHYDSHDVFIVQVSGSKTFRFYTDGLLLPYNDERFDRDKHHAGAKTEEIQLSAGDTLYIPRGMMHDAVAAQGEASLHITFGVYTATYKELMQQSLELLSGSQTTLRSTIEALKPGQDNSITPSALHFTPEQYASVAAQSLSLIRDKLALDALSPHVPGTISANNIIDHSSRFFVNHHNIMSIERKQAHLKLRLYSKIVEFQGTMAVAVAWILELADCEFTCNELPMPNSDEKIALCKKLHQDDVLSL